LQPGDPPSTADRLCRYKSMSKAALSAGNALFSSHGSILVPCAYWFPPQLVSSRSLRLLSDQIATRVRLKYVVQYSPTYDRTWNDVDILVWSVIEQFTALVSRSLPGLRLLLLHITPFLQCPTHLRMDRTKKNKPNTLGILATEEVEFASRNRLKCGKARKLGRTGVLSHGLLL
jgi:hypothetical protein